MEAYSAFARVLNGKGISPGWVQPLPGANAWLSTATRAARNTNGAYRYLVNRDEPRPHASPLRERRNDRHRYDGAAFRRHRPGVLRLDTSCLGRQLYGWQFSNDAQQWHGGLDNESMGRP